MKLHETCWEQEPCCAYGEDASQYLFNASFNLFNQMNNPQLQAF